MDSGLDRLFYRETVRDVGVADGKIIRQRSGSPVYAHVRITARALSRGKGVIIAWNAGSNIPARRPTTGQLQARKEGGRAFDKLSGREKRRTGVYLFYGDFHGSRVVGCKGRVTRDSCASRLSQRRRRFMMLDKSTFIKDCVITIMSDDYENVQRISEQTKRLAALQNIDVHEREIAEAIQRAISEGLAEAYVLSPRPPHSTKVEYKPDQLQKLRFYVTARGKEAAKSIPELSGEIRSS